MVPSFYGRARLGLPFDVGARLSNPVRHALPEAHGYDLLAFETESCLVSDVAEPVLAKK